jgi:hypothetical protein
MDQITWLFLRLLLLIRQQINLDPIRVAADSRQSEIASYPSLPLHHTTTYSRLPTILVITQDRYLLALSQFMKNRFEASVQV